MRQRELCKAIKEMRVVEFNYEGHRCSVAPYVVYRKGEDARVLLGGFQGAPSRRRREYIVSNITKLQITDSPFLPDFTFDTHAPEYEDFICRLEEPKIIKRVP